MIKVTRYHVIYTSQISQILEDEMKPGIGASHL
jgi:hypothetical protein